MSISKSRFNLLPSQWFFLRTLFTRPQRIMAIVLLTFLLGIEGFEGTPSSAADKAAPARKVTAQDMPRIPSTEPLEALQTFKLAKNFELELVAAEPMVSDPVDACFDEYGRMYVAEMHGYPFSQEPTKLNPQGGGKPDAGIIRLLQDSDGDGRMDRSTVFADKLSWPTSVCCYDGGLFVLAPQYLYYLKDTDGDLRADVREIVLSGFGRGNVQSVTNGLKWALDNKIYFAGGRNAAKLKHRGKPLFQASGRDVSFDPKTEKFALVSGGVQFGHSMDDWGNRFVCSNSNHIQQVIYPQHYLARNPYLAVSGLVRSIAADGASSPVFRISPPEPWRIVRQKWRAADKGYELVVGENGQWQFIPLDGSKPAGGVPTEYPVGYFTSATGVTIYRGNAYPEEFRGNAVIGDVGGNLVHRKVLTPHGVAYRAERADSNEELLRSTDNWFRPVNFVNAPDGTLYVLDMYRETIEHPYSIPQDIKQFLHLESGSDRGRIYRLVSPRMQRFQPVPLGDMTSKQLVAELMSACAWNRETAQRLLWQRQDKSIVPLLSDLVTLPNAPLAQLHALYTLAGLQSLTPKLLEISLLDKHPRIREHSIKLSEPFLKDSPALVRTLLTRCDDPDERVRFQLAFSIGEASSQDALTGLNRLARNSNHGTDIQIAMLSSVANQAGHLVDQLIQEGDFFKQPHAASLLSELSLMVGANPNTEGAMRLLAALSRDGLPLLIQRGLLTALGEGLDRRGLSLSTLLADPQTPPRLRQQVGILFDNAARLAADPQQSNEQRAKAIGLLAFAPFEQVAETLSDLLTPLVSPLLQRATVDALAQHHHDQSGELLLAGWTTYSPAIRQQVIDAMLSSIGRIKLLLAAIRTQTITLGDLSQDKRQVLLTHPNQEVRKESQELLGGEIDSDRAQVVAAFQSVLELQGSIAAGLAVFKKNCSVCHRVGTLGYSVAPDLVSVQNKSVADLLIAILDPNREAQPNYNTYVVVTESGRIHNGIIVAETSNSITLRRSEAKEDVILRTNIEEMVSSGISLMPEGLEKDLSAQDLADVIAFIKSIKPQ
jgi:putative membrane-bound dehydrogenase-like protein